MKKESPRKRGKRVSEQTTEVASGSLVHPQSQLSLCLPRREDTLRLRLNRDLPCVLCARIAPTTSCGEKRRYPMMPRVDIIEKGAARVKEIDKQVAEMDTAGEETRCRTSTRRTSLVLSKT